MKMLQNVYQLGESQENVFTVGLPSVDLIKAGEFSSEDELVKKYGLKNINNIIVFTQHPIPLKKITFQKSLSLLRVPLKNLN